MTCLGREALFPFPESSYYIVLASSGSSRGQASEMQASAGSVSSQHPSGEPLLASSSQSPMGPCLIDISCRPLSPASLTFSHESPANKLPSYQDICYRRGSLDLKQPYLDSAENSRDPVFKGSGAGMWISRNTLGALQGWQQEGRQRVLPVPVWKACLAPASAVLWGSVGWAGWSHSLGLRPCGACLKAALGPGEREQQTRQPGEVGASAYRVGSTGQSVLGGLIRILDLSPANGFPTLSFAFLKVQVLGLTNLHRSL